MTDEPIATDGFVVVTGDPTDEELAAVTTALLILTHPHGAAPADEARHAAPWTDSRDGYWSPSSWARPPARAAF